MTDNLIAKWTLIIVLIALSGLALHREPPGPDQARNRPPGRRVDQYGISKDESRKGPARGPRQSPRRDGRHDLAAHRHPRGQGAHDPQARGQPDPDRGSEDDRRRAVRDQGADARPRKPRVPDRASTSSARPRRSTSPATGPTSSRSSPSTRPRRTPQRKAAYETRQGRPRAPLPRQRALHAPRHEQVASPRAADRLDGAALRGGQEPTGRDPRRRAKPSRASRSTTKIAGHWLYRDPHFFGRGKDGFNGTHIQDPHRSADGSVNGRSCSASTSSSRTTSPNTPAST